MKKLILVIFIITAVLHSAEIIPIWHTESGAGDIQDMELLKGGDQFIILAGEGPEAQIQIRNTEDGELVSSFTTPISTGSKLKKTPDSTRILVVNGSYAQLRNLDSEYSIVTTYHIESDSIKLIFNDLTIDPIRPIAYLAAYGGQYINGKYQSASKILAYNYETGEHIIDLTGLGEYEYQVIDVSDDGKYLATINEGKAYLKVWDLETMELIRDVQLYDDKLPNNEWWCDSKDIQFSKLNSDVVYYSGNFPNKEKGIQVGLFKYNIISSNSTDDITKSGYSGKIIIFDNDYRSLVYSSRFIYFNNFTNNTFDRYYKPTGIYPGTKTNYNKKNNCFLGVEGSIICKFQYDIASNTKSNYEEEIKVIPNPTNNFVNIELNCIEPLINYQINDINGLIIFQSSIQNLVGNIRIDFTSYPSGVYFITINCGNDVKTYKVVREG